MMRRIWRCAATLALGVLLAMPMGVSAATTENPKNGSIGVEGKIPTSPPKIGASITIPGNGQSFTNNPVTVSGVCPAGLLVKIFDNGTFVGSVMCANGSFSLQINLFMGKNDLVARVYDDLDQTGPDSNIVTVTLDSTRFNPLGVTLLTLTSPYARRGANPGETLSWPIVIGGGTPPYAVSVDWGDASQASLVSQQLQGTFDVTHVYSSAGLYNVAIKAVDKNGLTAFLQVVGVANGVATQESKDKNAEKAVTKMSWVPTAGVLVAMPVAFWLGRRHELAMIRKHLVKNV
jgi:hypothetical protein